MGALALGALAALCWGLHDLCVRRVSRRAHIPSCLLIVLVVGALAQLPLLALPGGQGAGPIGGPDHEPDGESASRFTASDLGLLFATGLAFASASYGLYRAFAAGPVRIVASVVGTYPVATAVFAVAGGASFGVSHWAAVCAVVIGVALVASGVATSTSTSEAMDAETGFALGPTLVWSLFTALAFATTFALGQGLTARFDPVAVSLGTRSIACLLVVLGIVASRTWRAPGRGDWPVLALMGLLDAGALGAVLLAGPLPDAVLASVTTSLFGVVTILLARWFLAEAMSVRQWVGVVIAFAAIGWFSAA